MLPKSLSSPSFSATVDAISFACLAPEFHKYISDINSNFGSNPMMGMPYNVSTNIYPEGKAVGFFEAYSSVNTSIIY